MGSLSHLEYLQSLVTSFLRLEECHRRHKRRLSKCEVIFALGRASFTGLFPMVEGAMQHALIHSYPVPSFFLPQGKPSRPHLPLIVVTESMYATSLAWRFPWSSMDT